jgi:cold shock CspA family protein
MSVKIVPAKIITIGFPNVRYQACDGTEFIDAGEAYDYDSQLHISAPSKKKEPVYDRVSTIQEAINMAVAEGRVVRFLSKESNKELKSDVLDRKGCKLRKPDRESNDIAVIPPSVDPDTFDFDEVDTSISVNTH